MTTVAPLSIAPGAALQTAGGGTPASSGSGFSFSDLLDIVNPLQHLPIISTIYRAITGDQIGDVARVAGDTLYGGLIGLGSSLANLGFRELTGKDAGDMVLSLAEDLTGWHLGASADPAGPAAAPTALAQAGTSQPAGLVPPNTLAALTTAPPFVPSPAASTGPLAVRPAQAISLPPVPSGVDVVSALQAQGFDLSAATAALTAYGKALGLSGS